MLDLSESCRTREEETRGAWHERLGGRFLIAPLPNSAYSDHVEEYILRHSSVERFAGRSALVKRAELEATAHAVLLGWENLAEGGRPLSYSPSEAIRIFERYPTDVYAWVRETAAVAGLARQKNLESSAGNSSAPSNGMPASTAKSDGT